MSKLEDTCFHESGHAVAIAACGFGVLSVEANESGNGATQWIPAGASASQRAIIVLAGPCAEDCFNDRQFEPYNLPGRSNDVTKAIEFLYPAAPKAAPIVKTPDFALAVSRAQHALIENWQYVERLAWALVNKRSLAGWALDLFLRDVMTLACVANDAEMPECEADAIARSRHLRLLEAHA